MSTTNDAPIKSNQVPDNHTSEANNQAQLSIFAQIQSKIIDYIVLGIFAIIIILIIYYYVKKLMNSDTFQNAISGIKKGIDTLKGAVNRGTGKPLGCDIDETNRSGLCYKNCNSDEESDGTQRCYKNPPNWSNGAIWPGGKRIRSRRKSPLTPTCRSSGWNTSRRSSPATPTRRRGRSTM